MTSNTRAAKLANARRQWSDARRASEQRRAAVVASGRALRRLERDRANTDPEVRAAAAEYRTRVEASTVAAASERLARTEVESALNDLLPADATEIETLSSSFPIVLLPVRLETRFGKDDSGGDVLKVRIYPDELMADTHEPPLTEQELEAGIAFWREAWIVEHERTAWRALVSQMPSTRAAWVARALTPANLTERPGGEPVFADVDMRPESWTRAAEARVLPDRWLVVAYRGRTQVRRVIGLPIQDPLALSLSPLPEDQVADNTVEITSDGLRLDTDVAWTVDFARALEVGMAVTMPLDADLATGIDRLIVLGVKASLTPEESAERLAQLLDAQHYTRGLAFVRQGTPTNNTPEAPSGVPALDPDGAASFAVERVVADAASGANGPVFTNALGVPQATVRHVEHAQLLEQPNAQAMNAALWPATWAYFLDQMMDPVISDTGVRIARTHFVGHVRGRGPLPAFRTGTTPYGLLPVSSLGRWLPRGGSGDAEEELVPLLRNLQRIWQSHVAEVPRIGASPNPDDDLLAVLGMDASAREARARPMFGTELRTHLFTALNISSTRWQAELGKLAQQAMDRLGRPEWQPRISSMTFADQAHLVRAPFVAPAPLSESEPLQPFNYISWIKTATLAQLREEQFPSGVGRPTAILYYLLRHAALALYTNVATKVAIKHNAATRFDLKEPELQGDSGAGQPRATVWERLERRIPNVTGALTLGDFVLRDRQSPDTQDVRAFRAALAALEHLPTAELDRLTTETLDTCSHRLDAWITSLASKRLGEMRQLQPLGSHLGAFGWVEDLRPNADRSGVEAAEAGGYIHAPSASHAAAAAVLRNGYLTRSAQDRDRYAIDLSSTGVRAGLELLAAVRQGQPLGAVLGYRFERGLHEGHRPLRLDEYIEPFRRLFPLVAEKSGGLEASGEAVEAIAARNVVDGLLLREAAHAGSLPWGQHGLPGEGADRAAIEAQLEELDRAVDAVADLLAAESVFQVVRGNSAKAASVLDAVGQGLRPPEPEIALQPRTGTTATHRVAVVLGGEPLPPDPWTVAATPRAFAEPYLDRWVGALLGDPTTVLGRLAFRNAASETVDLTVSLADLGLRPIDLLALTARLDEGAAVTELDTRLAALAPESATEVEISYDASPTWDRAVIRTIPDALELTRAINALLASSRALVPRDLLPPDEVQAADGADPMTSEADDRASAAGTALARATGQLQAALQTQPLEVSSLRGALRQASLFVSGAFPSSGASVDALAAQASTVLDELRGRRAAAATASDAREKVRAVFGRDFVFLPRFRSVNAEEIDLAVTQAPALVGDPRTIIQWAQQVSRVRPALASWRHLSLLVEATAARSLALEVIQLPHAPDARWVGAPFASESERPPSGRLSLALHRPTSTPASTPWVGFIVDEWTEIIPHATEDTAIAFHYDDPGAEAAQCVLVAVPPTDAATWDLDTLLDTLNETLDLAKVRAVDGELLPLGQLLPAIYMASNPRSDTVSTDLRKILQRAPETEL